MIEREKVIKGLEFCTNTGLCDECPFYEEINCNDVLEKAALKVLKEQNETTKKERKEETEMENNMENKGMKLSPPWLTYCHEVTELFKADPEVEVKIIDGDEPELKLMVKNDSKADAIEQLLPDFVEFGNVKLKVVVVPANKNTSKAELLAIAFYGNDVLRYIERQETPFGPMHYVVFKREVMQFYNDELYDLHGVRSMLYADAARDVFGEIDGVHFNTDTEE